MSIIYGLFHALFVIGVYAVIARLMGNDVTLAGMGVSLGIVGFIEIYHLKAAKKGSPS